MDKNRISQDQDQDQDHIQEPTIPPLADELVEDFLFKTRRLIVTGEITDIVSAYICCHLQMYASHNKPVFMYINSPGGSLSAGYAIIDQMLLSPFPIYTIVRGQAHSMGAIIAAFGKTGHRYVTSNSSIMLHSMIVQTPQDPIEKHTAALQYLQTDYQQKVKDLASRTKLSWQKLMNIMQQTYWLLPKQAIKIGIVDKIWTPKMELAINKAINR